MSLLDLPQVPANRMRGRIESPLGREPQQPVVKRSHKKPPAKSATEIVAEVCDALGWGFTSQDVADLAKLKMNTVSEYMVRMERRGLLHVTGVQRRNGSGRAYKIYACVEPE